MHRLNIVLIAALVAAQTAQHLPRQAPRRSLLTR